MINFEVEGKMDLITSTVLRPRNFALKLEINPRAKPSKIWKAYFQRFFEQRFGE